MEHHGINYETWINGRYGDENNPIELIWDEINDHIRYRIIIFFIGFKILKL